MRTFNEYKHRESRAEEGLKASKKGAWCLVPPLDGVSAAPPLLNAALLPSAVLQVCQISLDISCRGKTEKMQERVSFLRLLPVQTTREYINIRNTLMSEIVLMDEKRDQNFQTNSYSCYNLNWFLIVYTLASLIFI